MEHAWQLAQAGRYLGPQERPLDAIERVLRQRLWGWQQTGRLFNGLSGWELATGKIKTPNEIYTLYPKPADRDASRDYTEGAPEFGGSSPEGLVYLPGVLAYYLQHRSADTNLMSCDDGRFFRNRRWLRTRFSRLAFSRWRFASWRCNRRRTGLWLLLLLLRRSLKE